MASEYLAPLLILELLQANTLGAKPNKIHILVGVPFTRKIPSNYDRVIYFEDWMLTFKLDILLVLK